MIFESIHIQNFKAIKDMTIQYEAGLWEVIGRNLDGPYISNGSSKTTAMEAIQQCLFNRTTLAIPIESTARRSLGSSTSSIEYILTTTFTKNGHRYKVINDRKAMKITVIEDGVDLGIRSIPMALKKVQTIIGMDISTFITLTFITHTTISELLENFSSSSLMKIILDFNQIIDLDKAMKAELKIVNERISGYTRSLKSLSDSIEVLAKYKEIDTSAMHSKKARLTAQREQLRRDSDTLNEELRLQQDTVAKLAGLTYKIADLEKGVCNSCGQSLGVDEEALIQAKIEHERVSAEVSAIPSDTAAKYQTMNGRIVEIVESINEVSGQIIAADTKNQIYQENKERSDDLQKLKLETGELRSSEGTKSDTLAAAIKIIKGGSLHKHLMASFVSVLNKYLAQFKEFVNLPYIAIMAEANKSNVGFVLHDTRFAQSVHLHTLSGGEKTRLRLILLLAMLYTIKDMTNASTNLLIFDESLDTLDTSASPDLARLFNYLIAHDSKFIGLISHGQQLQDIEFNGRLIITKDNGVASLEVDYAD